jgi:hypothetical protein
MKEVGKKVDRLEKQIKKIKKEKKWNIFMN